MTNSSSSIFDSCEYVNLTAGQTCAICDKPDWCQTLEGKQSGRVEAHVCRRPDEHAVQRVASGRWLGDARTAGRHFSRR